MRPSVKVLFAITALAVVARLVLVAHEAGDFDEFQLLHGAWSAAHGLLPYRDFWENHGPAPYYLLAWVALVPDDYIFFAGRGLAAACGVAALALTHRLARRFVAPAPAWAAVAMLAWTPIFAVKTVEIRPDVFLLLLWLAAAIRFTDGRAGAAGLWLGAALWISPKALFGLAALGAAALAGRRGRDAARLVLGFAAPVALLVLGALGLGVLGPLWRWMVVFNFTVPRLVHRSIPDLLLPSMLALEVLAAVAAVASRRAQLAVATAVLVAIYLFVMPTPYVHSLLPALPLACVLAATLLERARGRALWWSIVLVGALAVPMASLAASGKLWARDSRLSAELEVGAFVRAQVPRDGTYYGPAAYPIARRSAWFFHVVTGEVAEALARGLYPPAGVPALADALVAAGCPPVVSGTNFAKARSPEVDRLLARSYRVAFRNLTYTVWLAGSCGPAWQVAADPPEMPTVSPAEQRQLVDTPRTDDLAHPLLMEPATP